MKSILVKRLEARERRMSDIECYERLERDESQRAEIGLLLLRARQDVANLNKKIGDRS